MSSGQNRKADRVDVLLQGGRNDHLGRLAQTRIDDFEAFVAQSASEHLGSAIMPIEPRLGDENLERSISHGPNDNGGGPSPVPAYSPSGRRRLHPPAGQAYDVDFGAAHVALPLDVSAGAEVLDALGTQVPTRPVRQLGHVAVRVEDAAYRGLLATFEARFLMRI